MTTPLTLAAFAARVRAVPDLYDTHRVQVNAIEAETAPMGLLRLWFERWAAALESA